MAIGGQANEKLLVRELAAGNEVAFRKLFDAYRNVLFKYCLGMVGSKAYAEEIVQDVFLKVWTKRERLDPELSFKSYLFTITRNNTIKFLKKAARDIRLREEIFYRRQVSSNPTEKLIREKELDRLKKEALDQLPAKRRIIFEMSRNEGKSHEDIAKELGLSTNTVRNQISRALETMRNFLIDHKDISLTIALISSNWV